MVIQTHKIIHLSMDFFPPPHGNMSHKHGFLAEIPRPITESSGEQAELPATIRCIFSESTSHSIATESILGKLSGKFLWLDGIIKEPDPLYNLNATQPCFFTSALGDACQEDRRKENPTTPQLEVLGALDLYFEVNNDGDDDGDDRQLTGLLKRKHHFHLPQVIVVKELFPCQPPITATNSERLEVCLGQDFFQTYPHLLFEFTPSPACDILISSVHKGRLPTLSVDTKGIMHVYTAGVCMASQESEQDEVEVHGGFGVYFSLDSVYNTFHHLPALRSGARDPQFRNDIEASAGFGNAPPTIAPTEERADLASFVLALEMVISLFRLGHSFRGVRVHHNSDYFKRSQSEPGTGEMKAGIRRLNADLVHRLFLLQAMIEDPKRCNLGKVEFHMTDDETLFPAIRLAKLGAQMWAFTGSITYIEQCIATGCEHPIKVSSTQTSSPSLSDFNSPSTNNTKFDFMSIGENISHQSKRLEDLGSPRSGSSSITLGRSRSGSLSRSLKGKVASRVPMFLNYGSTITYISQGKLVAFTPRGLFLLDKQQARAGLSEIGPIFENKFDGTSETEQGIRGRMTEGPSGEMKCFRGGTKATSSLVNTPHKDISHAETLIKLYESPLYGYSKCPSFCKRPPQAGPTDSAKPMGTESTIDWNEKELRIDKVDDNTSAGMRTDVMGILEKYSVPQNRNGDSRAMIVQFGETDWKLEWEEDSDTGDSSEDRNVGVGEMVNSNLAVLDQNATNLENGEEAQVHYALLLGEAASANQAEISV